MLLYHGSPARIERPDLSFARGFRDFGPGFYLAEEEVDAASIAIKGSWAGYLHVYDVDYDRACSMFRVCEFDGFSREWLRFVYDNRMGDHPGQWDIVIGPTAGGRVNDIFESCRRASTPFEEVEARLAREITRTRFGYQWCILSDAALDLLELVEVENITTD